MKLFDSITYYLRVVGHKKPEGMYCGVTITNEKTNEVVEFSDFISINDERNELPNTRSCAEYYSLKMGLEWLLENKITSSIRIITNSKPVSNQLQGVWEIKGGTFLPLHNECVELLKKFKLVTFNLVGHNDLFYAEDLYNKHQKIKEANAKAS